MGKRTQITDVGNIRNPELGIPELLRRIHLEKLSAVLPVKVQPCLKNWIRHHGGSAWVRETILLRLEKEAK